VIDNEFGSFCTGRAGERRGVESQHRASQGGQKVPATGAQEVRKGGVAIKDPAHRELVDCSFGVGYDLPLFINALAACRGIAMLPSGPGFLRLQPSFHR
jgi:hypothetical protein